MPKSKTTVTRTARKTSSNIPIVGIGASAGGLEAFTKLLTHLPADTGMAFVLIQHLSPDYESFLTELLTKATKMPVTEVTNGLLVRRNNVYVIPPNVSMTVQDGRLRLAKRPKSERPHLVVDFFFRSLAENLGNDAIGVVLSGTGSDGAEGLKAIKGEGGISFAQDPKSAKFSGMPERAMVIDHVDFVLTPEEIGRELAKVSRHPYLRLSSQPSKSNGFDISDNDTHKVIQLIKHATGIDFSHYKRTTIQRRIMRRMALRKVEKLSAYHKLLQEDRAEQIALHNDILINVTSFFRDPEVYEKLKTVVFPALMKERRTGDPIRVWVAGCSTGEEAYSMAIALLEFLGKRINQYPIQIFGSDLSEPCITKARAGKYMEGISENVSRERLSQFFVTQDKGYMVNKTVRDCCVFAKQDLVNDPPYSRLDLVSCRNVLIYLEPNLQRKVLNVFSYAIKPTGFLVLGSSETPSVAPTLFAAFSKSEKIYTVSNKVPRVWTKHPISTQSFNVFPHPSKIPPAPPQASSIERDTDQLILTHYAPPCVVINDQLEVVQFRGDTSPYLANPTGRPSFNILKMAKEGLGSQLKPLIERAKKGVNVKSEIVRVRSGGFFRSVTFEIYPLRSKAASKHYFILFREKPASEPERATRSKKSKKAVASWQMEERLVLELEQELAETKRYLESLNYDLETTNQDLQSANEEVLSANEELQSTNEELETAKEELQSGNEELTTVNDELQSRNNELDHISNDLSNLLSNIEIPILMIGTDGKIRKITPAAQKALNLLSSDIGRPIRDMSSNFEVLGLDLDLDAKVTEVVESMTLTETEIQDRNGHWFRLQVRPYRTLDHRIDGAVVALIDIDLLKRSLTETGLARAEAEKARGLAEAGNRAKDVFLATLSHELRTPLTSILSYSQILLRDKSTPESQKKALKAIERGAQTQAKLINDLLDVSRIIMGKLSLDLRELDPIAVLNDVLESVQPLMGEKSIRLVTKIEEKTISVRGDLLRLKQVFLNLITNAMKFSKPDGKIEIHVNCVKVNADDCSQIEIQVRDFGKGIPSQFLPMLFDRFSQVDSSSTRVHGGMGLGLAIVRSLVEAQGGTVRAESPGAGMGSTFTVTFPVAIKSNLHANAGAGFSQVTFGDQGKSEERPHQSLKSLRILLVDDDPGARESIGAVLSFLDAEVTAVSSASEAIKALSKVKPDIIVSDLAMPGEDGLSFLKRLRKRPQEDFGRVPALALTAFASDEDARQAIAAGFQAHLAKPVDSVTLADVVYKVSQMGKK